MGIFSEVTYAQLAAKATTKEEVYKLLAASILSMESDFPPVLAIAVVEQMANALLASKDAFLNAKTDEAKTAIAQDITDAVVASLRGSIVDAIDAARN